ncbi:MAG: flagellar biosynthesis protein [Tissierella sp.]|nr:flagellar biosynthesis protein [Tissierella sp.]
MTFRIDRRHLLPTQNTGVNKSNNITTDFKKVLDDTLKTNTSIKISGHAQQRMVERGIRLQEQDMNLISNGMDKLEAKGGKESLMLYKDMAFIASVENRTIITAMGNSEIDTVTNIDSAIIIK